MKLSTKLAVTTAVLVSFTAPQVLADAQWNVSLWGKRRAFTEHVEKLAE